MSLILRSNGMDDIALTQDQIKYLTVRLLGARVEGLPFIETECFHDPHSPRLSYVVAKSAGINQLELYNPKGLYIKHVMEIINSPAIFGVKDCCYIMYDKWARTVALHTKRALYDRAKRWIKDNPNSFERQAKRAVFNFVWAQDHLRDKLIWNVLDDIAKVYSLSIVEAAGLMPFVSDDLVFEHLADKVELSDTDKFSWFRVADFQDLILSNDMKFFIMSNMLGG